MRPLVRLVPFLREQRSDAVGELRTERCLEPTTIVLGELSDEPLGEIAANCCFEAVCFPMPPKVTSLG